MASPKIELQKYHDQNITGYTWIEVFRDGEQIGVGRYIDNYIAMLSIDEPYRRYGYGTTLLTQMEQNIKENGYTWTYLLAQSIDNLPQEVVVNFYKKNGYVHFSYLSQWLCWFGPKHMYKNLNI